MSQNIAEIPNNIFYELTQKNNQIDFLLNENNQYSQLINNLQSELFSLKKQLSNFNDITNELKLSQEKNIKLEEQIKQLNTEILSLTDKNKKEKRERETQFYDKISKLKIQNEGFKSKIDMTNYLENEKKGLMNALDTVVKSKNEILIEQEKIIRENKINSEIKIAKLKKRMLQSGNDTQNKLNDLNGQYSDASTKLAMLQNQQLMIKCQYQIGLIRSLQKNNNLLEKENYELRKDLEIHKGVELSLAHKYKKLREDNEIKHINLTSYNNNIFKDLKKNLSERNNSNNIRKNKNQKIKNLKKYLLIKQNNADEENKSNSLQKNLEENLNKYLGIYNFLEECLKLFFNDDYLKSKRELYIHIDSLKKGDFRSLTKEEKYSVLVILLKYLMPLFYINIKNDNNNYLNGIKTKFSFVNKENNIKYLVKNNQEIKKDRLFRNFFKKKFVKKSGSNLELPFNFSYNSSDNSIIPREKLSFLSTKNNNNNK